jgi:DNA modification methylase
VSAGYDDGVVRMLIGDCRELLATLPTESVQCVVTSPPYWGLRDYGTPGQLGLEPTPELYVANMVEVFRAVRRVLRDDGTVWLNLGDSYASGEVGRHDNGATYGVARRKDWGERQHGRRPDGLKPKDLVGMPWRVAFALQADGWYLRADIIWAKPNPMPESVTDRPTKAHEYVFLLAKNARYFYDGEAIREPQTSADNRDNPESRCGVSRPDYVGIRPGGPLTRERIPMRYCVWNPAGRNRRSVWTIASEPYPEAHFATFPTDLVVPCIQAGTSARGCCAMCGAPWARVVEHGAVMSTGGSTTGARARNMVIVSPLGQDPARSAYNTGAFVARDKITTGWRPTCACDAAVIPSTVLDPFAGSGTVLYVAKEYGRRAIGIELNPAYGALAQARLRQEVLAFR